MFSWATSHLEKLAQTVAPPPPNDSFAALHTCCQRGDEDGAIAWIVNQQNNAQQGHQGLQHDPSYQGQATPSSTTTNGPVDPLYTIVQPIKGQTILHWSCLYALPKLLHYCLEPFQSQLQQQSQSQQMNLSTLVDNEGHSVLHYAAMSDRPNGLDIIKLVLQYDATGALIRQSNRNQQTAYDVAVRDSVRQYLLPLQLQAETQAAIDNGGVGLPPGIDLGGLSIQNPHLAPPPIMSMGGSAGGAAGVAGPPTSMYAPPPMSFQTASPQLHQAAQPPPPTPLDQQHVVSPTANTPLAGAAPTRATTTGHMDSTTTGPTALSNGSSSNTIPRPPTSAGAAASSSSSYARTGRSSAAILPSRGGIQPDGFHSSSSDKNLQEKYGHVNANSGGRHLPPPPSSGNGVGLDLSTTGGVLLPGHASSAPPSLNASGAPNPFAGGVAAIHRGATAARRYVAYDPFSGSGPNAGMVSGHVPNRPPVPPLPPPPAMTPVNFAMMAIPTAPPAAMATTSMPMPPAPMYNANFAAPSQQQAQQQSAQGFTAPMATATTTTTTTTPSMFMSPPAMSYGTTPANTPAVVAAASPMPVPSSSWPMSGAAAPSVDSVSATATNSTAFPMAGAANNMTTPVKAASSSPSMGITPPPPPYSNLSCGGGSSIGFHRSNSIGASPSSGASPEVAAALFAQPAAGNSVGGATTAAAINEASVALPSHTPTMVETTPTPRSALELFGTPASTEPQQQPQQLAASFAPQNFSAPMEHAAAAAIGGDDDLQMDDIPLTPGDGSTKPVILPVDPAASTVSGNAGPTAIGVVADTASNSLFGAIGMPPPPFSRK